MSRFGAICLPPRIVAIQVLAIFLIGFPAISNSQEQPASETSEALAAEEPVTEPTKLKTPEEKLADFCAAGGNMEISVCQ